MQRRSLTRLLACAALVLGTALPAAAQKTTAPRVKLETSMGNIVLELDAQKAPKTVANFVQYVKDRHYDGTVFHRVIDGFMIQGGGFTADMNQKPTRAPIKLESQNGLKNSTGWIAMARTSVPDSATSQFFINVVDNSMLNHPQPDGHGYAVFGKVVKGMDTVEAIKAVRTGSSGMHRDVPAEPVVIQSMSRVSSK